MVFSSLLDILKSSSNPHLVYNHGHAHSHINSDLEQMSTIFHGGVYVTIVGVG